jgi:predicted Zn-dependent protease
LGATCFGQPVKNRVPLVLVPAFVIAHEIGHHLLGHVEDRLRHRIALENNQHRERELERARLAFEALALVKSLNRLVPPRVRRELRKLRRELKKFQRRFSKLFPAVTAKLLEATAPILAALLEMPYDQNDEFHADMLGLCLMHRSGFDLNDASAFFERMNKKSGKHHLGSIEWLGTHPSPQSRLRFVQQLVMKLKRRP